MERKMDQSKPWYASKTIWLNVIAGIAAVSSAFGLNLGLDTQAQAELAAGGLALVNVILRLVSKTPIATPS
jgi:hypothetical protein